MLRESLIIAALVSVAACGGGQRAPAALAIDFQEQVPVGTQLALELAEPFSATAPASPIGAEVHARTLDDLRDRADVVLVPRGAGVVGRVIDREESAPAARVWVRIESIAMGGAVQRMRGELLGPSGDRFLSGELPRGARLGVRLTRPIASLSALRAQ